MEDPEDSVYFLLGIPSKDTEFAISIALRITRCVLVTPQLLIG